ncbi:MAG: alkaline phosphatase family protein [Candidatus Korarchaeota archaeon]
MKLLFGILDGASSTKSMASGLKIFKNVGINSITTVYPSVTYAAHTSIITGELPSVHKVLANRFIARGDFTDFDSTDINRFVETPTLFEKYRGSCAAIGIPLYRGAKTVITMKEVLNKPMFERNKYVAEQARSFIENHDIVVANFLQVDTCGETFGPESKEYLSAIDEALHLISEIIHDYKCHYIITADHGMTSVNKRIPIDDIAKSNYGVAISSHRFVVFYKTGSWMKQLPVKIITDKTRLEKMGFPLEHVGMGVGFADGPVEFMCDGLKGSHGGDTPEEMVVPFITDLLPLANMVQQVNEISRFLLSIYLK